MPTLALGNGQPDSFFVTEVRRIFRDQGTWQNEAPAANGVDGAIASATSKPVKVNRSPVLRSSIFLTAPAAAAGQGGFTAYKALFDPPPPITIPVVAPVISDGGAGGTWAAGTYRFAYTYVTASGEFGMSPLSNALTIVANHQITLAAITGLTAGITALGVYAVSSVGGSSVGQLANATVTAGASALTTYAAPPAGANVGVLPTVIISDTGEVFFPLAPATGTINVTYQTARYSDQQMLDALYEGLGMLYPEVWSYQQFDTTSVQPSPVQYEYVLPASYGDPKVTITQVEVRPPSAFVIFTRIGGWRLVADPVSPTLVFAKPPPAGGQVRITYTTPYAQLADVPALSATGQLSPPANLPVYYAVARLLADAEVMRSRSDDLPALTAENAGAEKGGNLQTAAYWMQRFDRELGKISIGRPMRRMVAERAADRLGLSPIWRTAA